MDELVESCENFSEYPKNIIQPDALSHTLEALHERLISQSKCLFNEKQADVDFLELHNWATVLADQTQQNTFVTKCVKTLPELRLQLRDAFIEGKADPKCRFM